MDPPAHFAAIQQPAQTSSLPQDRSPVWRGAIVNWTLRLLAATQLIWLAITVFATPRFPFSAYGIAFLAVLAFVVVAALVPSMDVRLRLGAILAFLGVNITIGFLLAGPAPGNTVLVIITVLFATLFWGLRAGLVALGICLAEACLAAAGWMLGIFPPGGIGASVDPHLASTWIRGATVIGLGAGTVAIVVDLVIRQLARSANEAAAALEREKQSDTRYRELFERSPLGIYRTTPDGRILAANPALVAMLGFSHFEELATIGLETVQYLPGYERAEFKARIEREGEIRGMESLWRRRDGSTIFIRESARAIRDSKGSIVFYDGILEDFNDRKALEERQLHAQRLEVIGTLASGIAHDLNNILTPVLMASGLLQERLPAADRELMNLIEGGARRGAEIIRKLLIFSRSAAGTQGPVQPLHLLKEMSAIMRETFPRNIEILEDFPSNLSWVSGDSTQLHQVLMNLCVNARDAMPAGGRLTLSASNVMLGEQEAALHESTQPGPYVVLSVADTGHGIPPDVRARIFDPYFTTKTVGQGTGLGLSSAFGIVKNHLGFITVDSAPEKGATFRVFLPASAAAPEVPAIPAIDGSGGGKGRLILVVDDEPAVLLATKKVLEKAGYFVITAADGALAEKIMEARAGEISLVITDLMMPGMDGVTLVPRLRRLSDKAKFIGVSGQDQTHRGVLLAQLGFAEMLSKPYEPDVLRASVKRVLG